MTHRGPRGTTFDVAALSSIERILGDLVAIDSVSARSNVEIARYLRTTLEHLGCAVTELRYRDDLGIVKVNLVAILGPSREVLGGGGLALSIHVDTPAWAPEWRDALTLRRNEGRLHGRGVCSGKGFAAAAIAAVSTVDVPTLERPVALVFTADGEMGGLGARRLTENHTVEPLAVIVAEPTSNRPARATKGSFVAEIDIEGREVNSAYPDLGASAIRRATEVLEGLKRIEAEVREDKDPTFDPPYSTLNVGMLQAGRAANLVPGHCRLVVEWRPTSIEDEHLAARPILDHARDEAPLVVDEQLLDRLRDVGAHASILGGDPAGARSRPRVIAPVTGASRRNPSRPASERAPAMPRSRPRADPRG